MNLKLVKLTAFLLIWAGTFASCVKPIEPVEPPPPEIIYPINVSFEEYSLDETLCNWRNLPYDDKVMIINSVEELEKYIQGDCPTVDFSKYTLLLASGNGNSAISKTVIKDLQQLASDQYELSIEITMGFVILNDQWNTALLVEKMNTESKVAASIAIKEQTTVKLELGTYRQVDHGHITYVSIVFQDKENIHLNTVLMNRIYAKYEITEDHISLYTYGTEVYTYFFQIISNTKFEITFTFPDNPEFDHIAIYEKK